MNSEFFASVGNTLITSRETEDLVRTCYLPWVRQHLTAFDGDNTAAQQPANVLPPTGATPQALFHRLRLRGDYRVLAEFSWRYRPTASARRASPSGHGASGLSPCASAGHCRYHLSKGSLRVQELSSFSLFFNTQILAVLSQQAVTSW